MLSSHCLVCFVLSAMISHAAVTSLCRASSMLGVPFWLLFHTGTSAPAPCSAPVVSLPMWSSGDVSLSSGVTQAVSGAAFWDGQPWQLSAVSSSTSMAWWTVSVLIAALHLGHPSPSPSVTPCLSLKVCAVTVPLPASSCIQCPHSCPHWVYVYIFNVELPTFCRLSWWTESLPSSMDH